MTLNQAIALFPFLTVAVIWMLAYVLVRKAKRRNRDGLKQAAADANAEGTREAGQVSAAALQALTEYLEEARRLIDKAQRHLAKTH